MSDKFDETNDNANCPEGEKENINKALRSEINSILKNELKTDDAIIITHQTIIDNDSSSSKNTVSDDKWLKEYVTKLFATSSPIIFDYHKSEIENVNSTIGFILSLIRWVSFSTMFLVALFVILNKDTGAIISLVTGSIIDSFLGILTHLFNSTLKSKKSYFDAENDSSKFNKMLLLIQTVSDDGKRDSVIVDILRKYFNVDNDKK